MAAGMLEATKSKREGSGWRGSEKQTGGDLRPFFRDHFQKQQIGQLLDIVAVVDAVMAQGMAESPEFGYDIGHKFP